ncbi:GEVED domain-containing protein [Aquimarina macrocephali]|uniref:GEVED domain-containing protein n=1 Tax=Aquimarina macrocephali TaxID=666563 RepID=UPI0009FD02D2|nr:GEVED domain-containing protein [Aquimarina macrocephali]
MKTTNTFLSILMGLIIWPIMGQQQEKSCSFEETQQEYYEQNPEALKKAKEFEKIIQKQALLKKLNPSKAAANYVIPVVFHIYDAKYPDNPDTGESRNVTDARVIQALKDINEDFKGFNDAVDPSFSNIEGGMNIVFRLAQVDPNGNTTTGIIYHERKEGFGLSSNDAEIAKYAWDNFKYMNVHIQEVVNSGSKNSSGIAWFPAVNMSEEGTARVVYNGKYIIYSPPASSLTHEFGHFLGLHHTFNGGCVSGDDNGDKVADTPPTAQGLASEPGGRSCKTGVKNCFSQLINHQNHMDYNPCESMFTKGQVTRMEGFMTHDARKTLWADANLIATGTKQADLGARVIFTYQKSDDSAVDQALAFIEGFKNNNGDILNKKRIKAVSGAKFAVTGQMQEGVHFSTTNVPSGLTTKITVEDNENAVITFTGNAVNHSEADSKEIKITLLNPAIVGGVGSLYSKTGIYNINFIDPYKPYYEMYSPTLVAGQSVPTAVDATGSKFNSLVIGGQFRTRLRTYDGNTITVDNNAMEFDVLCNTGTINVRNLSEGTNISANSSGIWVGRQAVATSPPKIFAAGYNAWLGRTGYVGIRVPTLTGDYVYGWLKVRVSSNGGYGELVSFGLNPDPGKSIPAKVAVPNLEYSTDRFLESVKNDGTIGNEITVDLKDATLAVSGTLVSGTHYNIQNVPKGLSFSAQVVNSRRLKLTMNGIATESDWAQPSNGFVKNIKLKFKSSVFANGAGAQVEFKEFPLNVEYIGTAYSKEVNPINRFTTTGDGSYGGWAVVMPWTYNLDFITVGYQFQDYTGSQNDFPGVKFISLRMDAVANANYELTPLSAGTVIGPNSSWKNGQEYNGGRGQHMVDSETYRAWRGRTNYVGIRVNRSGRMHYGWLKLRVGTNGRTYEILEYGMQGIPEASIKAGTKDSNDVKTYCDAKGNNGTEGITKVEFAGINKSSTRDASGYSDYTGNTGFVAQGKSYPLKVNVVGWNGGSAARVYAWFDWNNDYDFRDSGEYMEVTKTSNTVGEITVNIPTNARLGVTRMRLRVDDRASNADCGDRSRGEVEDYQVSIGIANASCTDGEQNGDETGVDCGGSSCSDCIPDPTCDDGIKNGDETEVDCGGEFCEPCEVFTEICPATATGTGEGIDINKVAFGSISNSSTGDAQYTDYSNVSTNLTKGQQLALTVTTKNTWEPTTVGVWIDWNNDNDFRDDGEKVLYVKGIQTGSYSSTVTVPASAATNTSLRMRVRSGYYQDVLKPCGTITSIGEVEDYRVTVTGGSGPTCNDGIQNGDETGVDCGGSCSPCAIPTCTDGIQNGDETGVDCGGSCSPCQTNVTYCAASTTQNTLHITTVAFGSINNATAHTAYSDHTNISTNLTKGQSTALTVTLNNNTWAYNAVGVWIDWNNNGDFTDSGEKVYSRFAAGPYTSTITPPASAVSGTSLRMRVRAGYGSESKITPCGTDTYIGEVEDYTVTVGGTTGPTCSDNIQNGNETGVDCGGSCSPCDTGATCSDGVQNGNETGVDCGGSCPACPVVTYCAATGNSGPEGVTNVTFVGINKTSIRNASGYDNFTSTSTSVNAGTSHNLKVTIEGYNGGAADEIYAWFDWNIDGDFADTGEYFKLTKTTNTVGNISVTVPQNAKAGNTRMRVLVSYYDIENNPCDTGTNDARYGEYEDYTVRVVANKSSFTPSEKLFSVAPIPVSEGKLNITFNTPETGIARVHVYNIYGMKAAEFSTLKEAEQTKTVQFNANQLSAGLYLVTVKLGKRTDSVRVIVE